MPDISLLEPLVLNGVVQKFNAPQNLKLLNTVSSVPSSAPDYAIWDVEKGSRQLATFNTPGAEATLVDQLGRSQESARMAYVRLKKNFQPQIIKWLREPGSVNTTNAERLVMNELQDLSGRIDRLQEQLLWNALRGSSTITYPDGNTVTVNYGFPSSHLVSPGTAWTTATPTQIVHDIVAWKRLITTHGQVDATTAYCSQLTVQKIFDAFAANATATITTGTGVASAPMGGMLSDRMKDAYYSNSILPGFMGLDWNTVDQSYTDGTGTLTRFVGDGTASNAEVFIGNYVDQKPIEVLLGKSADDSAPDGMYGKFTKTWKTEDPSGRKVLMELHFLPVVYRPEQFIYCSNAG